MFPIRRQFVLIVLNLIALSVGIGMEWSRSDRQVGYPNRSVTVVVPFGEGGGTDAFARVMKQGIEENELLPTPLAIINVDGAGATIGSRRVKNEKPDGYTILVLHEAMMTAKASGMVNYGPEAFEPIAATGEVGMVIAVAEDSPYHSLSELMKAAEEKPDTITFGANLGAMTHFAGLQLEAVSDGAEFRYVQVGGGAKRFAELKGGHIDVSGFSIEEFVRYRHSGLRGLAYFGEEKHSAADDVSTAKSQGYPVVMTNVFYWWAPQGTSAPRVEILADALESAMQTPEVRGWMQKNQINPVFARGDALQSRIETSNRRIGSIAPPKDDVVPNFPLWLFGGVWVILLLIAVRHLRGKSQVMGNDWLRGIEAVDQIGRIMIPLAVVVAYVFLMGWGVGFRGATIAFVPAFGILVMRAPRRRWAELLLTGQILAFGLFAILTRVFVVDLP